MTSEPLTFKYVFLRGQFRIIILGMSATRSNDQLGVDFKDNFATYELILLPQWPLDQPQQVRSPKLTMSRVYWMKLPHFDADAMQWSIGTIRPSKTLKHNWLSLLYMVVLIDWVLRNIISILVSHRREYIRNKIEGPSIEQWGC